MRTPTTGSVEHWEALAATRWGRYITKLEARTVEQAQRSAPFPRRALDVGCGGGRWTGLLLDNGWAVTAVDVDANAVRVTSERNPPADCLVVDPADQTLHAEDRSVSLVVCVEVVQVTHSPWFAREAHRVLVPGGMLVTVVWNRASLRGTVTDAASRIRYRRPHTHYRTSYRTWRRELREAGFTVEDQQGLCWSPFGRASDSRLVPLGVAVERTLRLGALATLSPWVVVTAARS